jgi:tetratricopeptide (TPR) repeat protein
MVTKHFIISQKSACPCRSGKKYKNCCAGTINTKIKEQYFQLYQKERFDEALTAYRAFLTQYIIWYNEHTVPFVNENPLAADELLSIDIEALIETIHGIACCLNQLNKIDEIDSFLQKCTDIVKDDRFMFYILGERAFWFLFQNEEQKAKNILLPLIGIDPGKIRTFYERRYLEIFISLLWVYIPLGNCLKILDILSSKKDDPLKEAYYIAIRALIYFVYSDSESAIKLIDEAIAKLDSIKPTLDLELSILLLHASFYQLKGIICNDKVSTTKARELFTQLLLLIKDGELLVSINHSIGQQYLMLGRYKLANKAFQLAYELSEIPHCSLVIDYAKSYFYLEDVKRSREVLDTIDTSCIESSYLIDYYSLLGEIAIEKDDKVLAKQVQHELTELESLIPYFKEMITKMRIVLLDFTTHESESKTLAYKFREAVSKYILLQPNFFGLGINFNELIKPQKPKNNDD